MTKDNIPNAKGIPTPTETQLAVKRLMEAEGEFSAASALGISRQTLARLAGGMSVNRSTLRVVQTYFGITPEEPPATPTKRETT